jgi:hypothetical protein
MSSAFEITTDAGIHRYAAQHWAMLQPFIERIEKDPKGLFFLADDIWDLWPYANQALPSYAARYRVVFHHFHSFLKPFVKWYCYQQVLQRPGDVRTSLRTRSYQFKEMDMYLLEHGYTSLDDLAPFTTFEELWNALLPQKETTYTRNDVRLQSATRPFWLQISAMFGIPLLVPPVAPSLAHPLAAVVGLDEHDLIPEPVLAQLMNKLGLHRHGLCLLNRFHHLRLCVLLLHICLGRRITEVLLAPRGEGPEGPLTAYPARGKGPEGGLWFRFEPNKHESKNQVHVSPEWADLVRCCVKTLLFYSDEVRHLALPQERHLLILVSGWNFTSGPFSILSHATERDIEYGYRHLNKQNGRRMRVQTQQIATAMTYRMFITWLAKHHSQPSVFELWGITTDGSANGEIYRMRTGQARHTRQSILAQDPHVSQLTLQRDLNHNSSDMQITYQHHLRQANAKLREQIAQRKLHGLGTYWLEQCLGLIEPGAHAAFRPGAPTLLDARWRALVVNNPQFVQANRVPCGLCAFPRGPEGCSEFMQCTEATDEGCVWFFTDPNDVVMQTELQVRAKEHRTKQRESEAAGRTVQAHKHGVMAERTERIQQGALQKASEEVRQALLAELNEEKGEA